MFDNYWTFNFILFYQRVWSRPKIMLTWLPKNLKLPNWPTNKSTWLLLSKTTSFSPKIEYNLLKSIWEKNYLKTIGMEFRMSWRNLCITTLVCRTPCLFRASELDVLKGSRVAQEELPLHESVDNRGTLSRDGLRDSRLISTVGLWESSISVTLRRTLDDPSWWIIHRSSNVKRWLMN